jgi:hypothetical protein
MASVRNLNPFGTFLETLENTRSAPSIASREQRSVPVAASSVRRPGNATDEILSALQVKESVDPAELLAGGMDMVELGQAIERLRSLDAISVGDPGSKQIIKRSVKYDDV